jgi:alcohol oxidase
MAYHKRPYADDTNDLETCNTYSVRAFPTRSAIVNEIRFSHGKSELVLDVHSDRDSCVRRYIDGTTGRRSDAAHHYVYNQAHNPNLQIWAGKRVKRVIFE